MSLSSVFLNAIKYLLTFASSSSRPFYFFLNVFQKAVATQDATNPVAVSSLHYMQYIPVLLDCMQHFFISHTIGPTDPLNPSPAPQFDTFQLFLNCCPMFTFQHHTKLSAKCGISLASSVRLSPIRWGKVSSCRMTLLPRRFWV